MADELEKDLKPKGLVASAANYKAPETKPVTTEVDAGQETVESRLNKMTESGSKYIDLAKKDAMRSANTRGLINSSMAAGAGTEAAIKSALPIAQQDATTYKDTRFNNQRAQNEFLQNRQSADLNMETAAHGSQLTRGEARLGSELKIGEMGEQSRLTNEENTLLNQLEMKRDTGLSELTQQEQAQLNELQMKRDVGQSTLKREEQAQMNELQMERDVGLSALTQEEQAQLNQLEMKRDTGLSELTQAEQAQLNELQMKRDAASSGLTNEENRVLTDLQMKRDTGQSALTIAEQERLNQLEMKRDAALSGLTNEQNTLLNELQMKRDMGESELTMREQEQLKNLEMIRDANIAKLSIQEAEAKNRLDINRDTNSAELNKQISAFESTLKMAEMELDAQLKTDMETTLNDVKFSDEMKLQIVSTMNNVIRDSQEQVVEIGMSDRTAAQQAGAIKTVQNQRDATLAVYQDLLNSFNDWNWGTDFTPGQVGTTPTPPAGMVSDGRGGFRWPEPPQTNQDTGSYWGGG